MRVGEPAVRHELDDRVAAGHAPAAQDAHRADAFALALARPLELEGVDRRPGRATSRRRAAARRRWPGRRTWWRGARCAGVPWRAPAREVCFDVPLGTCTTWNTRSLGSARMPRRTRQPADAPTARERLLAGAMEYVAEHGVGDLSLRGLAAALGTSHRMLIYHFGSREGLLIEVIRTVEAQQRAAIAAMLLDEDATPAEIDAPRVAPHRGPGALAERAPVLRDLHAGAPGPPPRPAGPRRDRRPRGSSRSRAIARRAGPRRGRGPGRGAPRRRGHARASCSTCSRPATARRSTPPWSGTSPRSRPTTRTRAHTRPPSRAAELDARIRAP